MAGINLRRRCVSETREESRIMGLSKSNLFLNKKLDYDISEFEVYCANNSGVIPPGYIPSISSKGTYFSYPVSSEGIRIYKVDGEEITLLDTITTASIPGFSKTSYTATVFYSVFSNNEKYIYVLSTHSKYSEGFGYTLGYMMLHKFKITDSGVVHVTSYEHSSTVYTNQARYASLAITPSDTYVCVSFIFLDQYSSEKLHICRFSIRDTEGNIDPDGTEICYESRLYTDNAYTQQDTDGYYQNGRLFLTDNGFVIREALSMESSGDRNFAQIYYVKGNTWTYKTSLATMYYSQSNGLGGFTVRDNRVIIVDSCTAVDYSNMLRWWDLNDDGTVTANTALYLNTPNYYQKLQISPYSDISKNGEYFAHSYQLQTNKILLNKVDYSARTVTNLGYMDCPAEDGKCARVKFINEEE